jgi:hypothetical protein
MRLQEVEEKRAWPLTACRQTHSRPNGIRTRRVSMLCHQRSGPPRTPLNRTTGAKKLPETDRAYCQKPLDRLCCGCVEELLSAEHSSSHTGLATGKKREEPGAAPAPAMWFVLHCSPRIVVAGCVPGRAGERLVWSTRWNTGSVSIRCGTLIPHSKWSARLSTGNHSGRRMGRSPTRAEVSTEHGAHLTCSFVSVRCVRPNNRCAQLARLLQGRTREVRELVSSAFGSGG